MRNFEASLYKPTFKQILKKKSPKIPNMGIIVNRGTASVHFNLLVFSGFERLDSSCKGIV